MISGTEVPFVAMVKIGLFELTEREGDDDDIFRKFRGVKYLPVSSYDSHDKVAAIFSKYCDLSSCQSPFKSETEGHLHEKLRP
jgi:hypothetical protein